MVLPLPRLDERRFADLVDEGRAQIPRLAHMWTDHNLHDPGITVIDLLSWLFEHDSYRFDRTTAESYRAFLRSSGVALQPAAVAAAILVLELTDSGPAVALPAGVQISDGDGATIFQTMEPLVVSPAKLVELRGFDGEVDLSAANASEKSFAPFGDTPKVGAALYLGFDAPLGDPKAFVQLHVWTPTPESDELLRSALIAEYEAEKLDATLCPPGVAEQIPLWSQHYSAVTGWEYFAGPPGWLPLDDVSDETRALSMTGAVRFPAPDGHVAGGPSPGRFWLRCRLVAGSYECPPALALVAINSVGATHAADGAPDLPIGRSNGRARQRFALPISPIVADSTRLKLVIGPQADADWREVPEWDRVGPHDKAYCIVGDPPELRMGDGRVGQVAPADATLLFTGKIGGGPEGNLRAHQLTTLADGAHNASLVPAWATVRSRLDLKQPFAAFGGKPAETLARAQVRAIEALAAISRAVTLADFAAIACATPGVPVARAYAIANHHPSFRCVEALGSVTVVVVPACPEHQPVPSADFLRAVARYIGRRRPLTTELHVVPPCYTTAIVHARLQVIEHVDGHLLKQQAQQALDHFFHPLHGGPNGGGWPAGRAVYRSEIMERLAAQPGVIAVSELALATRDEDEARCGNIEICADGLIASGAHQFQLAIGSTCR